MGTQPLVTKIAKGADSDDLEQGMFFTLTTNSFKWL